MLREDVSECFGQLIRTSSEIRGIKLPGGRECNISQYAYDNNCFVTNDCGLLKELDIFERYGRASGAKLNRTKSKGLWLGRWRQRLDSPGGLMWSDSTIKIVGFHWLYERRTQNMGYGSSENLRGLVGMAVEAPDPAS